MVAGGGVTLDRKGFIINLHPRTLELVNQVYCLTVISHLWSTPAEHFTRLLSEIYDGSQMATANELTICFGIRLHLFGTITNIKP